MSDGPLVAAFNATLRRLSEIEKELDANDQYRQKLIEERQALGRDIMQARNVLAHLTPRAVDQQPDAQQPTDDHRVQRKRSIQPSSSVGWALAVLRQAKRPMHIDELLKMIAAMSGLPVNKPTLVSNLSRYVKAGNTFLRTGESTYALIEQVNGRQQEEFGLMDSN